jgi:hypothetical protein
MDDGSAVAVFRQEVLGHVEALRVDADRIRAREAAGRGGGLRTAAQPAGTTPMSFAAPLRGGVGNGTISWWPPP